MECRGQCQVHPGGRSRKVSQQQVEHPVIKEQQFFYEYPTEAAPPQQNFYEGSADVKQQNLYKSPACVKLQKLVDRQGDVKYQQNYDERCVSPRQQQSPVSPRQQQQYYDDLPVGVKQRSRFDGLPTGLTDGHEAAPRRLKTRRDRPAQVFVNRDHNSISEIPVSTGQGQPVEYPEITEQNGSYIIKMGPPRPGSREQSPSIILSPETNGIWVNVTNSRVLTTNTVMRKGRPSTASWDVKREVSSVSPGPYQQVRESASRYPLQYQHASESSSAMPVQYQQTSESSPAMPVQYQQVEEPSSMPVQYQQVAEPSPPMSVKYQQLDDPSSAWSVQYQQVAEPSPAMATQYTLDASETASQYSPQYQSTAEPSLNYPTQENYSQYPVQYQQVAEPSLPRTPQYRRRPEPSPRRSYNYQLPIESSTDCTTQCQREYDGNTWYTDNSSPNIQQNVCSRMPQSRNMKRR